MGANLSCPSGFEQGVMFSCRVKCPDDFKYAQEGGDTSPLVEKCVYSKNNEYFVQLRQMPAPDPREPPADYAREQKRVSDEIKVLRDRIFREAPTQEKIQSLKAQRESDAREYSSIQSQYANYSSAGEVAAALQTTAQGLRGIRPPVAGSRDIEAEKRKLLQGSKPNMLLIQVAIAVTVLALLVYLLVPVQYAHPIAFLLVSMGIAVGIFLRK
jgi:hypothetical protein